MLNLNKITNKNNKCSFEVTLHSKMVMLNYNARTVSMEKLISEIIIILLLLLCRKGTKLVRGKLYGFYRVHLASPRIVHVLLWDC